MRKLQDIDGSGVVTMPKQSLKDDGIVNENGDIPDGQGVDIRKLGRRTYVVRFPENGELPELTEAPLIQQVAAQIQFVPRSEIDADPDPDAGRVAAGVTEDDNL